MSRIDEVFDMLKIKTGEVVPPSLELRHDLKQALYKDLYEIISFSADRAEAYKKLKDYFGETND